jgi:hypothetical protein
MFARVSSVLKCAVALALAAPGALLAQADAALVTALAECRALGNDRMRLACFDDVVVRVAGVTEPVANDADAPVPVVEDSAAPEPRESERARRRAGRAEAEAAPAPESVQVTIVEVDSDNIGRTRFVTDTGVVFQQTDSRSRRYPETPFAAEVRGGALGSSFLVISGGRAVRVTQRD